jgi:hypothetical protein
MRKPPPSRNSARNLPRMLPRPLLSLPRGHLAVRPSRRAATARRRPSRHAAVSPGIGRAANSPCGSLATQPLRAQPPACATRLSREPSLRPVRAAVPARPSHRMAVPPCCRAAACRRAAVQSGKSPSRRAAQPPRAKLGIHSRLAVAARASRRAKVSTCGSLAASPHGRSAARMSHRAATQPPRGSLAVRIWRERAQPPASAAACRAAVLPCGPARAHLAVRPSRRAASHQPAPLSRCEPVSL